MKKMYVVTELKFNIRPCYLSACSDFHNNKCYTSEIIAQQIADNRAKTLIEKGYQMVNKQDNYIELTNNRHRILLKIETLEVQTLPIKKTMHKDCGQIENNFIVVKIAPKTYQVEFRLNNYTLSLIDFKSFELNSEETLCFNGQLVVNGKQVGTCSNDGRGGCANVCRFDGFNELNEEISKLENYCFPKMKCDLYSIVDQLASFVDYFQNQKEDKKVLNAINEFNRYANELREKYK